MINKPVLLISSPRTGSTWVQEYVTRHNSEYFNFLPLLPYEFLNNDFQTYTVHERVINFHNKADKLKFLSSQKEVGLHYSFKTQFDQIQDCLHWFNEYVKDYYVIKLIRKDAWGAFLSYTVQEKTGWQHKESYTEQLKVNQQDIDKYLTNWLNFLQYSNYNEVWYYEDLTDDKLIDLFKLKNFSPKIQLNPIRRSQYKNNIVEYDNVKAAFENAYSKINYSVYLP